MKRLRIAPLAVLMANPAVANVVFPAFTGPYVAAALFPASILGIFVCEVVAYKFIAELSLSAAALIVVAANVASSTIGVLLGWALPAGLAIDPQTGVLEAGPHFMAYFWLGFAVAYLLSVVIEASVLKLAVRKLTIRRCLETTAIANAMSYCLLGGIVAWQM